MAIDWFRRQAGVLLTREQTLSEDKTFSVLSVGSGEGDVDFELIRALLHELSPRWETLRYVALEPNATHRAGFLYHALRVQRLDELSCDERLNISVVDERFEEIDIIRNNGAANNQ